MFGIKINTALAGLSLLTLVGGTAQAAQAAQGSIVVVHGVPGRDVAETLDPALPVDVLVNGTVCLLRGMTFGEIAGPFDLPTGTYTVAISLANPISPCSGAAVISGSVTLADREFVAVVAQFSAGRPIVHPYHIDTTKIIPGDQRFYVLHAADAPSVQFSVQSQQDWSENCSLTLDTGHRGELDLAASHSFIAQISTNGSVIGEPITVSGGDQSLFIVAVVGTAQAGSVALFSKTLYSVH